MSINDTIKRVCAAQPKLFLGGHEGYYRHSDVSALVAEIGRLRSLYDEEVDARLSRQAVESKSASDEAWAVWGSE